ncbi:hypothetical protein BD410DRAFT_809226 [Rickenella mellea]|uniref:Uncharacterized protein n=1 Tax=Rickenella mellea TaxID=50990 RepID=A0A4Y7PIK4_9AGAM|nr:hypothetical protein BD410DRAFT_809226 [Rickenella mellea]
MPVPDSAIRFTTGEKFLRLKWDRVHYNDGRRRGWRVVFTSREKILLVNASPGEGSPGLIVVLGLLLGRPDGTRRTKRRDASPGYALRPVVSPAPSLRALGRNVTLWVIACLSYRSALCRLAGNGMGLMKQAKNGGCARDGSEKPSRMCVVNVKEMVNAALDERLEVEKMLPDAIEVRKRNPPTQVLLLVILVGFESSRSGRHGERRNDNKTRLRQYVPRLNSRSTRR